MQRLVRLALLVHLEPRVLKHRGEAIVLEQAAARDVVVVAVHRVVSSSSSSFPLLRRVSPGFQTRGERGVHLGRPLLRRDPAGSLRRELLLHLVSFVLLVIERLRDRFRFAVQPVVHEEPVHVRAEHLRADESVQPETREFLSRAKPVVVERRRRPLFLHLFREVLQKRAPRRRGTERGGEVTPQRFMLQRGDHQPGAVPHAHVVDLRPGFDRRERLPVRGRIPNLHDPRVRAYDPPLLVHAGVILQVLDWKPVVVVLREHRTRRAEVVDADQALAVAGGDGHAVGIESHRGDAAVRARDV
mmetsp:Transcript_7038/g.25887  ORF Transcript_7038/g.25887 Transcript_7038/m.25887 type:complete len:301 (-) Transcript_7038:704-1606(-)